MLCESSSKKGSEPFFKNNLTICGVAPKKGSDPFFGAKGTVTGWLGRGSRAAQSIN